MTTATNNTRTATTTKTNTSSTDRITISLMGGASVMIGLWAAACFVGAIISNGPATTIKGFFTAVTGM